MSKSTIEALRQRLQQALPGLSAQLEMTSRIDPNWQIRADHRKGAVLALLYRHQDQLWMVFMQRTRDGNVHSGQISFPGGRIEADDPDSTAAALREAEEELQIPQTEVEVVGDLTELYIPASNFLVYPKVGYLPFRPDFVPEQAEVAKIIEVPLAALLDDRTLQKVDIQLGQGRKLRDVPAFVYEGHIIWGATAMMLNELLTLLRTIQE
ncbi:MAG: CoA pyrophosphatase [Bacteroidota bacterium]